MLIRDVLWVQTYLYRDNSHYPNLKLACNAVRQIMPSSQQDFSIERSHLAPESSKVYGRRINPRGRQHNARRAREQRSRH